MSFSGGGYHDAFVPPAETDLHLSSSDSDFLPDGAQPP
jgi:hypothetical protein